MSRLNFGQVMCLMFQFCKFFIKNIYHYQKSPILSVSVASRQTNHLCLTPSVLTYFTDMTKRIFLVFQVSTVVLTKHFLTLLQASPQFLGVLAQAGLNRAREENTATTSMMKGGSRGEWERMQLQIWKYYIAWLSLVAHVSGQYLAVSFFWSQLPPCSHPCLSESGPKYIFSHIGHS